MKFIPTLLFFLSITLSAQWKYKSNTDPFDGDYKTAYVVGTGQYPYNDPLFVINNYEGRDFNIYVTNFGYTGCDPNSLEFSFGDGEVYTAYDVNDNTDRDVLFIEKISGLDKYSFIKMLMDNSKMYIRHSNDCGVNRMQFSLAGSSKAIKYVIGEWLRENEEINKESEGILLGIIEYYKKLDCNSKLDSNTPIFIEKLSTSTNIFQTSDGPNLISTGTIVQYFNTESEAYPFKIRAIKEDKIDEYFIDSDTAIYITGNKLVVREMIKGLKSFRQLMEKCE